MSGTDPPIRFINPSKKQTILLKNTDDLEIETASDVTMSPPKKNKSSLKSNPVAKKSLNFGNGVQTKQPTMKVDGLDYLINPSKQREDQFSESGGSGSVYSDGEQYDNDDEQYYNQYNPGEQDSDTYNEQPNNTFQSEFKNKQEKKMRKQEMLAKLIALKNKGIELTKNYDMSSSYAEIEFEYHAQRKALDSEASVKFQRQFLVATVTGLEYLNRRFDPIGAKLNGWSESVITDIDSYDEVFRKLYEKYSSRAELPPEIELLVLLVGSAFMFHMTNSILETAMGGFNNKTYVEPEYTRPPPPPPPSSRGPPSVVSSRVSNSVSKNISEVMRPKVPMKTDETAMSAPSLNLSSILAPQIPPLPEASSPIKKEYSSNTLPPYLSSDAFNTRDKERNIEINNEDRFSMISSDTQVSISKKNQRGGNKKKANVKTINI